MDDFDKPEGPIRAALFDTALLSVFHLFERFREYGKTADPSEKAFADSFSDPDLLLNYLKAAQVDPETSGDKSVEKIWAWAESKDDIRASVVILLVADAIISYATQAMRAESDDDFAVGWRYFGEARYWEGILNGIRMRKLLNAEPLAPSLQVENPAVLMANKRHAANAAEKERVIAYWKASVDPKLSAEKAATQIVMTGLFSLEHSTIKRAIAAEKRAHSEY